MADVLDQMTEEEVTALVNDLKGRLGKDAASLVSMAATLGWKVVISSKDSVALIAPGDPCPKRIHLSARNKGKAPVRKMLSQVVRYADPMRAAVLNGVADTDDFDTVADALAHSAEFGIILPEHEEPKPRFEKPAPPPVVPSNEAVQERVKKKRYIVSEQPALMHYSLTKKGGRSYPSKTTIERRWSDGVIDYACAVASCDKTSDNRRSFGGRHWDLHVRNGEAEPVQHAEKSGIVDDPSYTEHAFTKPNYSRDRKQQSLTDLFRSIDLTTITPEELAEQVVAWQTREGGGGNGEPLTDEQVLDRIRTLVDRGTYAKQRDALIERDEQIAELSQIVEQAETSAAEAEARALRAESTVEALRDLITEAVEKNGDGP